jgi:hypothetical protein
VVESVAVLEELETAALGWGQLQLLQAMVIALLLCPLCPFYRRLVPIRPPLQVVPHSNQSRNSSSNRLIRRRVVDLTGLRALPHRVAMSSALQQVYRQQQQQRHLHRRRLVCLEVWIVVRSYQIMQLDQPQQAVGIEVRARVVWALLAAMARWRNRTQPARHC